MVIDLVGLPAFLSSESLLTWLAMRHGSSSSHSLLHANFSDGVVSSILAQRGHDSVTTAGIYAKAVDKITENPARYFEELMGFS
jgi:hypothetical protein